MEYQKYRFASPYSFSRYGPRGMPNKIPFLQSSPCLSQYSNRGRRGKKGINARQHLATLNSKTALSRVKSCQKRLEKFQQLFDDYKKHSLEELKICMSQTQNAPALAHSSYHLYEWPGATQEEKKENAIKSFHQYCRNLEEKAKSITNEAVEYYKKKAKELEKVEKSLSESKKSAEETMDEHWEIISNQEWNLLNNPLLLQHVLGFLPLKDLGSVMKTCSQMLHFVHHQVPVSINAPDMGNLSFNKWVKRFHHFRSLNCISPTNETKVSMYTNLSALAKNRRIDGLKLNQPETFKPKYFEKFQQFFQKNQNHLVDLTVEASLIPCFLTEEQLGRLETLTLLNLNKDNHRAISWVDMLPKMVNLEELKITSYDFNLKEVHLPATLKKLKILSSDTKIVEGALGARRYNLMYGHLPLTLPIVEHCGQLKEMWLDEVQDLTSLSLLPPILKMLKLYNVRFSNMSWPTSIHAERLELCNILPPPQITHISELTIFGMGRHSNERLKFLSSPNMKDISVLRLAEIEYNLLSVVQSEHALHEGATFEICEKDIRFSHNFVLRCKSSLLFKYGLSKYARYPSRCMIRGTPIQEAPDEWFKPYQGLKENIMRTVDRLLEGLKKRKRAEGGVDEESEPQSKKQKLNE